MIYKGCEKRMILLKNTGSELFEEAYFILNNKKCTKASQSDMIKEANRIISENSISVPSNTRSLKPVLQYIIGFLSGIGTAGLIMVIAM